MMMGGVTVDRDRALESVRAAFAAASLRGTIERLQENRLSAEGIESAWSIFPPPAAARKSTCVGSWASRRSNTGTA